MFHSFNKLIVHTLINRRKTVTRGALDNFFCKKGEKTKKKEVIDVDSVKKPQKKKKSCESKKLSEKKLKLAKPAAENKAPSDETHSKVDKMSLIVLEEVIFSNDIGFFKILF